ncbi:hypothetical protein SNE25_19665 [Mucilaginibacter sabulilitoris]|uniref:Uncharacterized protein n=1 Tax=Mucilaginibacter sabulilitoris TaxID=1173583 RepID=A0ABZ0TK22_9SPHI|nr:hypothetical protein [Mucilaginibacter sabulilitoris]WPU91540.1 hypothetical protein SNE25_19665 [Mucilaginibacter sabulilitoris]
MKYLITITYLLILFSFFSCRKGNGSDPSTVNGNEKPAEQKPGGLLKIEAAVPGSFFYLVAITETSGKDNVLVFH